VCLQAKLWEGRLLVVDSLKPEQPKTVGGHRSLPVPRGSLLTISCTGSSGPTHSCGRLCAGCWRGTSVVVVVERQFSRAHVCSFSVQSTGLGLAGLQVQTGTWPGEADTLLPPGGLLVGCSPVACPA
jgi:hypothetical protein